MAAQFKNINIFVVVSAFLVVAVLTAQQIIEFNAEAIVAISFVLFITFAYLNLSEVIVTELEDRARKIQKEFDHFFSLQEDFLKQLISHHEKRTHLSEEVKQISEFSKSQIKTILNKRQKALEHSIASEMQQKLKTILMKEQSIINFVQEETSKWFTQNVYNQFQSGSSSKLSKDVIIREGIQLIEKMANVSPVDKSSLSVNSKARRLFNNLLVIHKSTNLPLALLVAAASKNN